MDISWIDILIGVVFLLFITLGLVRGLIKTIVSLATFIVAIILSNIYYKVLAEYIISNTSMKATISDFVFDKLTPLVDGFSSNASWTENMQMVTIPQGASDIINKLWSDALLYGENALRMFSENIAGILINFLSFLAIFIVIVIVFKLVAFALNLLTNVPGVKVMDHIGGGIVGLVIAVLVNMIIVTGLYMAVMFLNAEAIGTVLNNSIFAEYFYVGYLFL